MVLMFELANSSAWDGLRHIYFFLRKDHRTQDAQIMHEVNIWCKENCDESEYTIFSSIEIGFSNHDKALAFRLRWC